MIPTAALPHTVSIKPLTGTTGTGAPAYGAAYLNVHASMVTDARTIRAAYGDDITAGAACLIRPGLTVPVGSLVTHGSRLYEVLEIQNVDELRRRHHDELLLDGPRPA